MSTRWYINSATTTGGRTVAVLEHRRDDGCVDLVIQPDELGLFIMRSSTAGAHTIPWTEIEDLVNAIRACENLARQSGWVPGVPAAERLEVHISAIENNGHRFIPRQNGWYCSRCGTVVNDEFPSLYAETCPGGASPGGLQS